MTQAGSVRPGGRTARTRAAVFHATLDELASRGWDQVSVESIARAAGAGVFARSREARQPVMGRRGTWST